MATRNADIRLKRSNIVGKIPTIGQLELGQVALNTADAKLYTEYTGGATGATEVREIGWSRVNTTGDTMTGDLTMAEEQDIVFEYSTFGNFINTAPLTANRNILFPDANGTVALLSDIGDDAYTTGTTLVGTTLYFDRTDSLSAYTADLSTLPGSSNDYTTGSTLIGTTAYFDRSDSLSAYTLDLSTLATGETNTASNIGGGEGLFSGKSGVDLQFKTLTSTGSSVTISSTGATVNLESVKPELTKSLYLSDPIATDDIGMWEPGVAITITNVVYKGVGATSTTFNINHSSGTDLWTSDKVATTTRQTSSSFTDDTCTANNYIRYQASAISGTPTAIEITITYTED